MTDETPSPALKHLTPIPLDIVQGWGLNELEGRIIRYFARWCVTRDVRHLKEVQSCVHTLLGNHS